MSGESSDHCGPLRLLQSAARRSPTPSAFAAPFGCMLFSPRIAAGFSLNSLKQTSRRRRYHHHTTRDHHGVEDRGVNVDRHTFDKGAREKRPGQRDGAVTVYLHVEICRRANGEMPTRARCIADHWNGDSLDNRRQNLRWVTKRTNNRNRFGSHFYQRELL